MYIRTPWINSTTGWWVSWLGIVLRSINQINMSTGKPVLPSLSVLLNNDKPVFGNARPTFCNSGEGFIRLPPLGDGGINRTRSLENALRHTMSVPLLPTCSGTPARVTATRSQSLPHAEPLVMATPSTPVVKKKSLGHSSRKTDMLTPLSAARAVITPSTSENKRAFAFITHSQETFPTKEPKIDNAPLARRKRRRTSTQELNILQAEFNQCSAPDKRKRQELAERCNMSEKAIQIWFQNKRQASKRQRTCAQKVTCHLESTPLASKQLTAINTHSESRQSNREETPETSSGDTTPTKLVPSVHGKKGQALTFHLSSDSKVLTPVKTSPNSRVNRLINNDERPRSAANSPKANLTGSPTKRIPLKELKVNALVH